ncbi:YccF domain-containing protein [Butyrivibrio sp. XPD2006]|uniref:YccF domain-containing protein n=1 Tax=Butyrivibrio sp. XPD2006 TaxID=1280668 RepID=UPI0003B6F235|nr:YccF domain-containing protein [Butyrivibrio sp. XPD2006]
MRILLNILWIICGGLVSALGFWIAGLLWCITVVGIPVGVQCFKLSSISLNPFGKEIIDDGGAGSVLLNLLWIILFGWELALTNAVIGLILCITIIGIPFGKQFFKIANVALFPFGKRVVRTHVM